MNPTTSESPASFFRIYTRVLAILNVCLVITAILFPVAGAVFFVASYVFNDSGPVPQMTAPMVRFLFLDGLFAIILLVWQMKTRKHLFAMLPAARKSMVNLGVAYVVIAVINLFQFYLLSLPLAAIGIWWLVVFSRSSTRTAFENPRPSPESLPPAS
jgi:drug/metabolite transporter (DMT)-like permease